MASSPGRLALYLLPTGEGRARGRGEKMNGFNQGCSAPFRAYKPGLCCDSMEILPGAFFFGGDGFDGGGEVG